jgi:hypothetical protein
MSGKEGLEEFKRIMEQPPSWAKDGLPIPCEVREGRRWPEPAQPSKSPTPLWRVLVGMIVFVCCAVKAVFMSG